jgi:hypothetical protein
MGFLLSQEYTTHLRLGKLNSATESNSTSFILVGLSALAQRPISPGYQLLSSDNHNDHKDK